MVKERKRKEWGIPKGESVKSVSRTAVDITQQRRCECEKGVVGCRLGYRCTTMSMSDACRVCRQREYRRTERGISELVEMASLVEEGGEKGDYEQPS